MKTHTKQRLTEATRFFRTHAGYSVAHNETKAQGRTRSARALADAEEWGREHLSFSWEPDSVDSSEFTDETPPWRLWVCIARGANGECVASLSGIDFGRDGEPWGQPYKRVVEAELALDAYSRA